MSPQNPTPLIHFILSLAYYPQTEAERDAALAKLGYDTTLEIVTKGKKVVRDDYGYPQYRFWIDSLDDGKPYQYETVKVLSNFKANDLLSRSTRVWQVRRIDRPKGNDGKEIMWVMKEAYAEEDIDTEGETWCDIRKRAAGEDERAKTLPTQDPDRIEMLHRFGRHFLQLEGHRALDPGSDVPRARLLPADFIRGGDLLNILGGDGTTLDDTSQYKSAQAASKQPTGQRGGVGGTASQNIQEHDLMLKAPRRKQRTLWKDANYVKPLDDLECLQEMHTVLVDTCHGQFHSLSCLIFY